MVGTCATTFSFPTATNADYEVTKHTSTVEAVDQAHCGHNMIVKCQLHYNHVLLTQYPFNYHNNDWLLTSVCPTNLAHDVFCVGMLFCKQN